MAAAYHKYGDLGAAAYDVLAARYKSAPANPLNLIAVKEIFEQVGTETLGQPMPVKHMIWN